MNDQGDVRRRLDRRSFVKASMVPAALAITDGRAGRPARGDEPPPGDAATGPEIVDTNVHLFRWPFRGLKYDRTEALVRKLSRHRIMQAWAGSFEAVVHKQLDAANRRLAEECRERGGGLLIPIGSVNPAWPDWEEDLRRCHEQYRMRGIRLYPAYHGYRLDHPELPRLLGDGGPARAARPDRHPHGRRAGAPPEHRGAGGRRITAARGPGQGAGSPGATAQRRHRLP